MKKNKISRKINYFVIYFSKYDFMNHTNNYTGLEVAIIGLSCRFPGANNWREFWENIKSGKEQLKYVDFEESMNLDEGYINSYFSVDNKDKFDPVFFGYRPDEVEIMNPVHRMFHECVWEALEDSGYGNSKTRDITGIYAGANSDFDWQVYSKIKGSGATIDNFTKDILSNRDFLCSLIAYKLDLRGPACFVNTACSTSLVAVHMACRALLTGEVNLAIAGGITLKLEKEQGYLYRDGLTMSKDGHCRTFDKDATGTVGSEGAGAIILKRLDDAIKDGDNVYAIVKGSHINNDGNRKVGFTAPSVVGQTDCIKGALKFSKVDYKSIEYIEAHGTATKLGDPIEVAALNRAFNDDCSHVCKIGSVKTNIGHLDIAAGIAGLIKTVLALKFRMLPPSLHFNEANPEINFAQGPFVVNKILSKISSKTVARAGVTSLGIGGTNAHVVLEEFKNNETSRKENNETLKLLVCSARTSSSLSDLLQRLALFIKTNKNTDLSDLCYTLLIGRTEFEHRITIEFEARGDLLMMLEAEASYPKQFTLNKNVSPIFILGDNSQISIDAVRSFYKIYGGFREIIDHGLSCLERIAGNNIYWKYIFLRENPDWEVISNLDPLFFLIEYGIAHFLTSVGIKPAFIISFGRGEYVSACLADAFILEDALWVLYEREKNTEAKYLEILQNVQFSKTKIPFYSSALGKVITAGTQLDISYLLQPSNEQITIYDIIKITNVDLDNSLFIEIGNLSYVSTLTQEMSREDVKNIQIDCSIINGSILDSFLKSITKIWEYGFNIDWQILVKGMGNRISIPTYAFDQKVFPSEVDFQDLLRSVGETKLVNRDILDWFYIPQWKLLNKHIYDDNFLKNKTIIVFSNQGDFFDKIIEGLECDNVVVKILRGSKFLERSTNCYELNPNNENEYHQLFAMFKSRNVLVDSVLHLWNIDSQLTTIRNISDEYDHYHLIGYQSILKIARTYSLFFGAKDLSFDLVSDRVYSLNSVDINIADKSLGIGALKVVSLEFPNIKCRSIGIESSGEQGHFEILNEIKKYHKHFIEVLIKNGIRYCKDFEKLELTKSLDKFSFRKGGIYLVTGGTGGLGRVLVQFLINQYEAKVIVLSRSSNNEDIGQVSDIFYLQCDIGCYDIVQKKIHEIELQIGKINGVFHLAGNADFGGVIVKRNETDESSIFSPKILGIKNLYNIFHKRNLDFFLNFSSLAASFGAFGQVGYTAANSYIDSFVNQYNTEFPFISVQLDRVLDVGMATKVNYIKKSNLIGVGDDFGLFSRDFCNIIEYVLSIGVKNQIISRKGIEFYKNRYLKSEDKFNISELANSKGEIGEIHSLNKLIELFESFFGIKGIQKNDNFFDLGGDSLKAMTFLRELRASFGVDLSLAELFDLEDIKELSQVIDEVRSFKDQNKSLGKSSFII
ncbi:SDR family NAD(P)-dependent oxidoreductase [Sphingobacterium sp. ML3W]|uniref:SDR family NAD(P)-dependent oxidoreductase n=1 Tax=Sphingobacterium sp. ML3W TaxID=1538644 RepID=UPI00249CA262|nr:SDR family NAD(P)-dependent oxidoreductase [Sphingobacterium sp. ML3W]WFA78751.1 SDR family NAD(P)-dependent oxidoreductase [Sphingobacterium sp. ML3W]